METAIDQLIDITYMLIEGGKMDPERIAIENEILDKLSGKIFLLQDFTFW